MLLATLAEPYVEVLDELVQLLDQALASANCRVCHELWQRLADRAKAEIGRWINHRLHHARDQGTDRRDGLKL